MHDPLFRFHPRANVGKREEEEALRLQTGEALSKSTFEEMEGVKKGRGEPTVSAAVHGFERGLVLRQLALQKNPVLRLQVNQNPTRLQV